MVKYHSHFLLFFKLSDAISTIDNTYTGNRLNISNVSTSSNPYTSEILSFKPKLVMISYNIQSGSSSSNGHGYIFIFKSGLSITFNGQYTEFSLGSNGYNVQFFDNYVIITFGGGGGSRSVTIYG